MPHGKQGTSLPKMKQGTVTLPTSSTILASPRYMNLPPLYTLIYILHASPLNLEYLIDVRSIPMMMKLMLSTLPVYTACNDQDGFGSVRISQQDHRSSIQTSLPSELLSCASVCCSFCSATTLEAKHYSSNLMSLVFSQLDARRNRPSPLFRGKN